jgi:hypothetical protein
MVNREESIGTIEHVTLYTRCRLNRCRYKRDPLYLIKAIYSPTPYTALYPYRQNFVLFKGTRSHGAIMTRGVVDELHFLGKQTLQTANKWNFNTPVGSLSREMKA